MYSSKSKITDLKKYFNKYKYTKKLLNYSNANKCNSLFSTSLENITLILVEQKSVFIGQ